MLRCTLFINNVRTASVLRDLAPNTFARLTPTIPLTLPIRLPRLVEVTEVTLTLRRLTVILQPRDPLPNTLFISPFTVRTWALITHQARTIIKLLLVCVHSVRDL